MLRSKIAAIQLAHSGILSNFQFLFSCRNYKHKTTNHVDVDVDIDVDDRQLFLKYVRHDCKLGFHKINHPFSLFHSMISLTPLPSIVDFCMLF